MLGSRPPALRYCNAGRGERRAQRACGSGHVCVAVVMSCDEGEANRGGGERQAGTECIIHHAAGEMESSAPRWTCVPSPIVAIVEAEATAERLPRQFPGSAQRRAVIIVIVIVCTHSSSSYHDSTRASCAAGVRSRHGRPHLLRLRIEPPAQPRGYLTRY